MIAPENRACIVECVFIGDILVKYAPEFTHENHTQNTQNHTSQRRAALVHLLVGSNNTLVEEERDAILLIVVLAH